MRRLLTILLISGLGLLQSCNDQSSKPLPREDTDDVSAEDTTFYFRIDSTEMIPEWNDYHRVKNLLEFHTKDTMRVDSTYLATLAMGTDISSNDLKLKIEDIVEPGGSVKVRDTTQEIGLRMSATLEDKGSSDNPYFNIDLIGGKSNIRTFDKKQNKMIWQWNVTPKKAGRHQLILSISRVDSVNSNIGSPETRHHRIIIFSAPKKNDLGSTLVRFLDKNWQWMIGAIGLPIFIAWFTTRRKRLLARDENKPAYRSWRRKKR